MSGRGMSRREARAALAAGVVVALVLTACSSSNTKVSPPSATTPTGSNAGALPSLSVQPTDVPNTFTVVLYPQGDQVQGQVTLDLCDANYPSEKLRVARRQVAVGDEQQQLVLSTEAVAYQSAAATQQAFSELRSAAAKCPNDFVPSPSAGVPLKTVFNPPPDGNWPAVPNVDRLAFDMNVSDQQGNTNHTTAVYLRRGRILLGVYFFFVPNEDIPAVDGQTTVQGIVNVFATRLSKLPASVTG
jgi:hypothetical protein